LACLQTKILLTLQPVNITISHQEQAAGARLAVDREGPNFPQLIIVRLDRSLY